MGRYHPVKFIVAVVAIIFIDRHDFSPIFLVVEIIVYYRDAKDAKVF